MKSKSTGIIYSESKEEEIVSYYLKSVSSFLSRLLAKFNILSSIDNSNSTFPTAASDSVSSLSASLSFFYHDESNEVLMFAKAIERIVASKGAYLPKTHKDTVLSMSISDEDTDAGSFKCLFSIFIHCIFLFNFFKLYHMFTIF
jgi:hypothetical protein